MSNLGAEREHQNLGPEEGLSRRVLPRRQRQRSGELFRPDRQYHVMRAEAHGLALESWRWEGY